MTLDNLLSLIDGTLLSQPSITSFNLITDKASRVQRGDLFICVDQDLEAIETALAHGAYGIVFDKCIPTIDDETAWIKVDSSFDAHLRLLRFHLMPKQIEVYYSDIFTLEYINMMKNSSECKIISDDISDMTNRLWNLHETKKLILKDQPDILTLFPMAKQIISSEDITLEAVTPLESNLSFNGLLYNRIKLPSVLHEAFNKAFSFLHKNHLEFNLSALLFPKSFQLIFCDNFFVPKEFGKGNITLLFIKDETIALSFLSSVTQMTPWIRSRLFLKENLKNLSYNNFSIFKDSEALLQVLKRDSFDLGVVVGASSDALISVSKPTQLSLF